MHEERIKEIEEAIEDLKGRWPAHSVKPIFWQQLEELEDELERLQKENEGSAS